MTTPIKTGVTMVMTPGASISRRAALVEISTHLPYSGLPVPSRIPGISRNWRRTSFTMSMAALPTLFMASAEKTTGIMPPMKRAASTLASKMLMPLIPVRVT